MADGFCVFGDDLIHKSKGQKTNYGGIRVWPDETTAVESKRRNY